MKVLAMIAVIGSVVFSYALGFHDGLQRGWTSGVDAGAHAASGAVLKCGARLEDSETLELACQRQLRSCCVIADAGDPR